MKTVFEMNGETNLQYLGQAKDIEAARRLLAAHGRSLCDDAGHSYTGAGGLTRSYGYMIVEGSHSDDLSLKVDGEMDYDRWEAVPRIEQWQVGRHNNKTFVRRIGTYRGTKFAAAK